MRRIKRNDTVTVVAGDDKGKTGKVMRVLAESDRVVIEGINLVYKHVKRSQQNPQGGRIQKEAPVHLSKVLPFCEKCDKGIKVKIDTQDGVRRRICRTCSTPLPE